VLLSEPVDEVHEVVALGIPKVLGLTAGTANVMASHVLNEHCRDSIICTDAIKTAKVPGVRDMKVADSRNAQPIEQILA
jgi:hypothetical protein